MGHLKKRFGVVKTGIRMPSPIMAGKIVQVAAMLHNYCQLYGDSMEDLDHGELSQTFEEPGNQGMVNELGSQNSRQATRQLVLDKYFL